MIEEPQVQSEKKVHDVSEFQIPDQDTLPCSVPEVTGPTRESQFRSAIISIGVSVSLMSLFAIRRGGTAVVTAKKVSERHGSDTVEASETQPASDYNSVDEYSDTNIILWVLVFWPVFSEFALMGMRTGLRNFYDEYGDRRIDFLLGFFCSLRNLLARFFQVSIRNPVSLALVCATSAVQELVMRQTFDKRDRLINRYVKRWTEDQVKAHHESERHKRYRAEILLLDAQFEIVGIILSPIFYVVGSQMRYMVNLGFTLSAAERENPLLVRQNEGEITADVERAMLALCLTLVFELIVDSLCFSVEEFVVGIPISRVWEEQTEGCCRKFLSGCYRKFCDDACSSRTCELESTQSPKLLLESFAADDVYYF